MHWRIRRALSRLLEAPRKEPQPRDFLMAGKSAYASHEVGEGTYGSPRIVTWKHGAKLRIGKYCSISDGVTILLGGEHRSDWITTYPFEAFFDEAKDLPESSRSRGDVVIGNDVWIGHGSLILSGTRVGDGAVIAAGSVVRGRVRPYSIVAGNPAEFLMYRFSQERIRALAETRWWDRPRETIVAGLPLLLSSDVDRFVTFMSQPKIESDTAG